MPRYRVIFDPSYFECDATDCPSIGSSHSLRSPDNDVLGHSCPTHAWLLLDQAKNLNRKAGLL